MEHLTKIDQFISQEVIKILKNISDFVRKSIWETGETKQGIEYIFTIHSHHRIYIYENLNGYTFKIGLKRKGVKYFDYNEATRTTNNSLEQVKELGFIVLKGLVSKSEDEKKILRSIYKSIININKK